MNNNDIMRALSFAAIKHKDQFRKDGSPYITHPIKVVELINKYFKDNPLLIEYVVSGYLHDTVEDTDATIEEIKSLFGDIVAKLVNDLTNDPEMVKKMGKTDYLCYKLVNMDDDALNIKLCDRLANIIDLTNAPLLFEERYEVETIVIINYVLNNRTLTPIQREIINEINKSINDLRKPYIQKLIKE